jgi:hypothetical protein
MPSTPFQKYPLTTVPRKSYFQEKMPRCCEPIQGEFVPCYASVLVNSDMQAAVRELEGGKLKPCITAWCSACHAPYLITASIKAFPSPSAHHAHMLVLSKKVNEA